MTEPQNQENPTPETPPEPPVEPTTPDARWTDKDMDKQKGGARKEGRSTGRTEREQEILEATGAQSVDEVLEAYKAWQTVQEESSTETDKERKAREKAERERDEANQKATDALKEANDILINAKLETLLISKGARADRLERLIKEADLSGVEVEKVDGKVQVKNLEPAVASLETEIPEWFGSDEQPVGSRPSSRAAQGPTNQQIDKEAQQAERTRLTSAL